MFTTKVRFVVYPDGREIMTKLGHTPEPSARSILCTGRGDVVADVYFVEERDAVALEQLLDEAHISSRNDH